MSAHGQTPDPSHAFGGAIFMESGSMVLSNTLVADSWMSAPRWPDVRGSGVYVQAGSLDAVNCTLTHNQGARALQNASGTVAVRNSILYFNNSDTAQIGGIVQVTYSDVQGSWEGEGNRDYNPALDVGYCIIPGSPAMDAGEGSPAANDAFPPGLGASRNDMGHKGGPGGALWIDPVSTGTRDVFRVETGQLILGPAAMTFHWNTL